MDAKEIANSVLDNMAAKAIAGGAQPSPVLHELESIERTMREAYREGDVGCAVGYAMRISRRAQTERDTIDAKWTARLQRGEVTGNPFDDPEYMGDFANMRALDKWLAAYGLEGKIWQFSENLSKVSEKEN